MSEIQRSDVVESKDVIDVAMGQHHCIEVVNSGPKSLLPEIYRGVDEDFLPRVLDESRDSQSLVSRILGKTGLTLAPYRGHASRSSCSEES
jgi:hypothetical protein